MILIRYTDEKTAKIENLPVENMKLARQLFRYAVDVATSETLIELLDGSTVVKRHAVSYTETIPSVRQMPRYA